MNSDQAFQGYNLIAPLGLGTTWLVDMKGRVIHSWRAEHSPANSVYLMADGSLLRSVKPPNASGFEQGGGGGGIQILNWEGDTVWEHLYATEEHRQHHDIQVLPNGNILVLAWEKKTRDQAIQAGRNPRWLEGDQLWPDMIVELKPQGKWGAETVWEWHLWDHLIQDHDPSKDNFGVVKEHPELLDINYTSRGQADWNHLNSIHYHAQLDQILVSSHNQHEVWVIDHSTKSAEVTTHQGGKSGKGGDILYRWDNPQVYYAGEREDQQFFPQHDARWIPAGYPGAGNILVFNNGSRRFGRAYSSVDEIKPPPAKKIVWEFILPGVGANPRGATSVFRVTRYGLDYPAFKNRALEPRESLADALRRETPRRGRRP